MGRSAMNTPAAYETVDRRDWTDPCIEPTLNEILADPMMELVFRSDKLRRENVESFLRSQAFRLAAERPWTAPCRCA